MKLKVITATSKSSSMEVSDGVFGLTPNPSLLAQAVRVYRSNLRQGTSKVKKRGEVKRVKSKWYKQKGTGNARHGSRNAPIFVGGGVAHGPTGKENWDRSLSKKMKSKALKVALSMQIENIVVSDNINALSGKTKEADILLKKMVGDPGKVLLVLSGRSEAVRRSFKNLQHVLMVDVVELNTLQIAMADMILFTKDAVKILEDRLNGQAKKKEEIVAAKVETKTKVEVKPVVKAKPAVKTKTKTKAKAKTKTVAKPATKTKTAKKVVTKSNRKKSPAKTVKKTTKKATK